MAGLLEKAAANLAPLPLLNLTPPTPDHCGLSLTSKLYRFQPNVSERSLKTSLSFNGERRTATLTCCAFGGLIARDPSYQIGSESGAKNIFAARSSNGSGRETSLSTENRAECRTALVWFKRDLRMDDHPGLAAAMAYHSVLPVYVFDPERLAGWSADLIEELRDAVIDLRNSLRRIDSDLLVKFGRTEDVLSALVREADITDIITEEEVEMEWDQLVHLVSRSLSRKAEGRTHIKSWRNSIYEIAGVEELPDCYKAFKKQKFAIATPLDSPKSLPPPPKMSDIGSIPSGTEISDAIASVSYPNSQWKKIRFAHREPAEEILEAVEADARRKSDDGKKLSTRVQPLAPVSSTTSGKQSKNNSLRSENSEEKTREYILKGGATGAWELLRGYLSVLESKYSPEWQELYMHVKGLERRPGTSFRAIFGKALTLGTLSIRRIYHAAAEYEQARKVNWINGFGFSQPKSLALRDSESIEWYRLLALKTREQGRKQGFQVGMWRWRGYLVQYAVAGDVGPPVVFVHGFGAFWQHWRDNIKGVAESGHRVFALTMLGFGRSEKPLITYTDLVWGELVRDFILEVVREPAIVAGNSIGGYTVSVVAGLWPSLVKSVVLLNSAGRVVPNYGSPKYNRPRDKSAVAYYGSRLLLAYLQNLSNGMLTKCYPTNPSRADSWLQGEVMRASYDPNSTAVLEAMFHLRAPLPLNYYLDRYGGDILIIQGMRDPLHNSSKRASMLQAYCKNVSIQYVNAGHCPHDEVPADVNSILTAWLIQRESVKSRSAADYRPVQEAERAQADVKEGRESPQDVVLGAVVPDAVLRLKEVEELV